MHIAVAWGVRILAEDRRQDTWGLELRLQSTVCEDTKGVSRHMPGEDSEDTSRSEDTWASESTSRAHCPCQGASTSEAMFARLWPKTHVVAKTHGRAMTCPEVRSGEDARRREDKWAGEDTSRRQVGRRHASSRKRGWAKTLPKNSSGQTCVVARTRGRAKTLPAWHRPKRCPNVALLAAWRRQLPTWCQEAMWCRQMWRQNAASLAHVVSGSQLASPSVASKRGVREQG